MTFWSENRRRFLGDAAALGCAAALSAYLPAYARTTPGRLRANTVRNPCDIELTIAAAEPSIDGRAAQAMTINGAIPGPLIRWSEGDDVRITVRNELAEDSSIHWHGILLPTGMDGVPGLSFDGISPGGAFEYRFPVRQSGTYWYHSHTRLQEQSGMYGPLVIDPLEPERFTYDREHVIVLSDWTFQDPYDVLKKLKKQSHYYNRRRPTLVDFFADIGDRGIKPAVADNAMWARMRMDPTDLADVTGATYTYLMNGQPPAANWTGLFKPGERIRLRFINAAAMSFFDVCIPGLPMTVVQADGQNVAPIEVDEFRIAVAETYDVIVQPDRAAAYTVFAEAMDRSGHTRGTLAAKPGMAAPVPQPRMPAKRTMADMSMAGHEHHRENNGDVDDTADHAHHRAVGERFVHGVDNHGPGAAMIQTAPVSRLREPGIGLDRDARRVLVYDDLRALTPWPDRRAAARDLELHLTGNMERYMWSFDGLKFSEVDSPIEFEHGERLRLIMVNDTMMDHPIHLHGMWMELENGHGDLRPRKHTISLKPNERISALITAQEPGLWAFHCHLIYHMKMGMFRIVRVA